MCTELGPGKPHLQNFIEKFVSACDVKTEEGCTDKEKKFIKTWKDKVAAGAGADVEKQITRLEGMAGSSMKAELMQWVRQRLSIFKQLKTEL